MNDVLRHIASDNPRVMVVDGSKVARTLIARVLEKDLPGATVIACASGGEAQQALHDGVVDLMTTALRLPDMDGSVLAKYVREHAPQAYMPIVAVSGDVQERLQNREIGDAITDYFDKAAGYAALADFIRGYVAPVDRAEGKVLYVEDSRVVALSTSRMLERYGLAVHMVGSAEEAVEFLGGAQDRGEIGADIVLTDVSLKGEMSGGDLLEWIREDLRLGKGRLPVLVMTGDENPANQAALLKAGANDLVEKPVEERLLMTKLLFQLRVSKRRRAQVA
ncbi:MAG: Response regulator protein [Rhodanobacteraceae bacterium]|jgi:CheY-like chemotaxis protein|nr:MAG: Response regulator protein [Rhodanobacteraceae bacterium]